MGLAEPTPIAAEAVPEGAAIEETARAKVNLDLLVLGRRADGLHELDSLVVFTGLADRLWLEPAAWLELEITGPFAAGLPADADNLVLRAARLMAEALGRPLGARLRLEKNLPQAAGLGGGSSDAAAALRGLQRLQAAPLPAAVMEDLARRLGADVPVCLASRPMRMRGTGERLSPLPAWPALDLVLANPGLALPTARIFAARQGHEASPPRMSMAGAADGLEGALALLRASRNDLEPAARRVCPRIGEVLGALEASPGCCLARMSGSGATCFGLFADGAAARAAAEALRRERPGWWIEATRSGAGA
jgi:4-diphosphocytidyl-2-C-methyl-D-erythritol kinase